MARLVCALKRTMFLAMLTTSTACSLVLGLEEPKDKLGAGGGSSVSASGGMSSASGSGGMSSASGSASSSSSSSSSSSTGSSSSGGGPPLINGCDPLKLEDRTGQATVEIKFGDAVTGFFKYAPPCISVSKGANVTFTGVFSSHPLSGGEVKNPGSPPPQDVTSPIKSTSTGMSATFLLPDAGQFPYFCAAHPPQGMFGLIVVK
jgi:plastocyanin